MTIFVFYITKIPCSFHRPLSMVFFLKAISDLLFESENLYSLKACYYGKIVSITLPPDNNGDEDQIKWAF